MKLCILAAGIGSRMEHLSKYVPKCLLPVGNVPILSYIIEKVDEDIPIVIAVGYKSDLIKQFCNSAYPERNITFVDIDNYCDSNSGPGYSLLQCKEHLQCPFYLSTSDDIITNKLPSLDQNWIGVQKTDLPEIYSTAKLDKSNNVIQFMNKSNKGYDYAFIGVAGIKSYELFWSELEKQCPVRGEFVDAWLNPLLYPDFKGYKLNWLNVGIIDNYLQTRKLFNQLGMPKVTGNQIYIVNNKVIKIFINEDEIDNRINRSKILPFMPSNIKKESKNVLSYNYINGDILYNRSFSTIMDFINLCFDILWKPIKNCNVKKEEIYEFYYKKTVDRVNLYLSRKPKQYEGEFVINDSLVPNIWDTIEKIDWKYLYNIIPTKIWHGDLQFENIISEEVSAFKLIDWRDKMFSNNIGDVYYDLGKMYGSIDLPYHMLRVNNYFNVEIKDFKCTLKSPNEYVHLIYLHKIKQTLCELCETHGYDLKKIKILSAIIQLNMCPIHECPLDDFLYFYARKRIYGLTKQ